ncbi:hypothetical protein ABI59_17595 [Acidobacteria bacterium Mor1]|nr:hypothetical protein ABI59_17595 [Acidobacteria bacterium Mor1]
MARHAYSRFEDLDGSHPFKAAVPGGYVDYDARRLPGGEVVWFNFDLAREMGLIPRDHDSRLNSELRRKILDTFCLTIINEYELDHGRRYEEDRLPGKYMATRYLQLQHPGRAGRSSGDGRSVWMGEISHRGTRWDISACGTGVTRLCPATAEESRFFKTGNNDASYACGTSSLGEGISSALMSETFHRNGILTERVLAVLALSNGFAITVRAAPNLIRPSHFFVWLKQNDLERLRGVADLYIDRELANGNFSAKRGPARYRELADRVAEDFARAAARFEADYIFCWLDWDGDNCLTNGAVLDYGSVRQFGLFHREYRFDDGPRWSTSIVEQRRKARYIVQTFAQVRDFLIDGQKRPLAGYRDDEVVRRFDDIFLEERRRRFLINTGLPINSCEALARDHVDAVERFRRAHAYFERLRAARGPVRVGDGLNWNAIFSTRDLLRELPQQLLRRGEPFTAEEFIEVGASTYASRRDRTLTKSRRRMASEFQRAYWALIERASQYSRKSVAWTLSATAHRSAQINRYDRITGDAAYYAAKRLASARRMLSEGEFHRVIERYLSLQPTTPGRKQSAAPLKALSAKRIFDALLELNVELRHGL